MRIVIDLQSCQSGSRKGGIGRYSLSLAKEMIRQSRGHDFWVVLNSLFPAEIRKIRSELIDLLPPDRIKTFHIHGPIAEAHKDNKTRFAVAALARENFIESLRPDFVHVSSLFEGLYEETVTSVGLIGDPRRTAITLYDLIPLVEKEKYLGPPFVYEYYMTKIAYLKKAGLALSISEFSRLEGIELLGLSDSNVINISSAISPFFKKVSVSVSDELRLKQRLGIRKKFLMYTSSYDQRKNQEGLIKGFAMLPAEQRKDYQIVFVGNGWDAAYQHLRKIAVSSGLSADDIIFPGYITDEDLRLLYSMTSLFVFPSFREGFGLPVLEAMSCGAPTIGSNTTSIPEVIGRSDALFDPSNPNSIGEKIGRALFDEGFRRSLADHAMPQASKFSWTRSASAALDAIESHFDQLQCRSTMSMVAGGFNEESARIFGNKTLYEKIAEIPDIESISDDELQLMADCIAKNEASAEALLHHDFKKSSSLKVAWITTWNTRCGIATYSIPVISAAPCNNMIFAPYSSNLETEDEGNVIRCWENGGGDLSRLIALLDDASPDAIVIQFNYGFFDFNQLAHLIGRNVDNGRCVFVIMHSTQDPPKHILDRQLAQISEELKRCQLLVHTLGDVERLAQLGMVENVQLIPLGVHEDKPSSSVKLPVPAGRRIIATYGFALPNKGYVELVEAFSHLLKRSPDLHLLFVTAEFFESTRVSARYIQRIKDRIDELGISDHCSLVTEYLSNSDSLSLMSRADLIVIPYQNTTESSSGSARMALVSGRPVAVTPSPIFDDLRDVVYTLPGMSPEDMAQGVNDIFQLLDKGVPLTMEKSSVAATWVNAHGFGGVGRHIYSEICISTQ